MPTSNQKRAKPIELPEAMESIQRTVEALALGPDIRDVAVRSIRVLTSRLIVREGHIQGDKYPGCSDGDLVVRLLEDIALPLTHDQETRLRLLKGQVAFRKYLRDHGGLLSAKQAGTLLGISSDEVSKCRTEGRLIGLKISGEEILYPSFQIDHGRILPNLKQVIENITFLRAAPLPTFASYSPIATGLGKGLLRRVRKTNSSTLYSEWRVRSVYTSHDESSFSTWKNAELDAHQSRQIAPLARRSPPRPAAPRQANLSSGSAVVGSRLSTAAGPPPASFWLTNVLAISSRSRTPPVAFTLQLNMSQPFSGEV